MEAISNQLLHAFGFVYVLCASFGVSVGATIGIGLDRIFGTEYYLTFAKPFAFFGYLLGTGIPVILLICTICILMQYLRAKVKQN